MTKNVLEIEYERYESLNELSVEDRELAEAAVKAVSGAYAPYSKFNVGAAVRLSDGQIITGANQENAAYPSGLCAERTAMFYANANNLNEDGTPRKNGNWLPSRFSQGVKTNREVGLSVRSGNKEKTIDNDFQTTVKWNEEKIESESLGEVFAKDGNISKQGFNKEKNKYFSWRLEDEFQHFTDKFALYFLCEL